MRLGFGPDSVVARLAEYPGQKEHRYHLVTADPDQQRRSLADPVGKVPPKDGRKDVMHLPRKNVLIPWP